MSSRTGKARALNLAEFKRVEKITLLTHHAQRNRAILYMSFGLGLRACEIRQLKLSDVLEENGVLKEQFMITKTKGSRTANPKKKSKARKLFLSNKKMRTILTEHIEVMKKVCDKKRIPITNHTPLFLSQKGGEFTPNKIVELMCSFFNEAGILKGAKSHSGRVTFATKLIDDGCDLKAVADLLGHTNIQTTIEYHRSSESRLRKITEKGSIF